MPHPLELPGMLRAVVELVRGERLAGFGRHVVDELVARAFRGTRRGRFSGRCSGLVPGLPAIVRALNQLSEPAAGLRCIQPIGIGRRSLHVIHLPARKVRPANIPFFAFAIRRQDECALSRADQNSYVAHRFLSWLKFVSSYSTVFTFSQALS